MVVRSTRPPATAAPGFTFAADPRQALAEAKAAAGGKYVVRLERTGLTDTPTTTNVWLRVVE